MHPPNTLGQTLLVLYEIRDSANSLPSFVCAGNMGGNSCGVLICCPWVSNLVESFMMQVQVQVQVNC